ncbi:protein adenylyltransferase SelO [Dietzia sp.]|uniref:protein adenylyltransferase SelO n=1 Tax=Dietzia sp. TaxID=1871616 RepID=UPI002FD9241B
MSTTPHLQSRFADALPEMAYPQAAEEPARPQLVALNEALADELGLDPAWLRTEDGLAFLLGQDPSAGKFVAQGYSGHQFGQFNPNLGDGRALLLGEIETVEGAAPSGASNRLRDIHLKGSGRTRFSRMGDGRAALGPMLREYLVSEAMAALGVPTTRALAVIATGLPVQREEPLPGAVLVRVAASHLRVGSFQFARVFEGQAAASRAQAGEARTDGESGADGKAGQTGDSGTPGASEPAAGEDLVRRLADFAIERHYPAAASAENPYLALLDAVVEAQAELVARWMTLGFVHGVMNTDNMTLSGETIDYGPCAFMEQVDPQTVFSSIDHQGRYAYGNQPNIALWNLTRLAETLVPLFAEDPNAGIDLAREHLERFGPLYTSAWRRRMAAKVGLEGAGEDALRDGPEPSMTADGADSPADLLAELQEILAAEHPDHTRFFRRLADVAESGEREAVLELVPQRERLDAWLSRWLELAPDAAAIRAASPLYIPRNHLVEEALSAAGSGDLGPFGELLEAVTAPYTKRPGFERFAEPAPIDFGRYTTYCGT